MEHLVTLLLRWRNYWYRCLGKTKSLAWVAGSHGLLSLQIWLQQTSAYVDIWNPGCIDPVDPTCWNWRMWFTERYHAYIQTCYILPLLDLWLACNVLSPVVVVMWNTPSRNKRFGDICVSFLSLGYVSVTCCLLFEWLFSFSFLSFLNISVTYRW